jgi:endonuclease YncB( thermonuclease family)
MLIALAAAAMIAASPPISGTARAGDGDSLTIGATRIRLFGIDAPELNQTCQRGGRAWSCGQAAAEQLSTLVAGQKVRCIPVGADQHDRVLARCTAGHVDVNRTMVATGYAVAFRRYSQTYASAEESARVAGRGLWSGTFDMPAEVRAQARTSAAAPQPRERPVRSARKAAAGGGACRIKGNHSRRGEWIYHVPGMPYYEQTRAEATFCTEAEAQAAGYRRAIVK